MTTMKFYCILAALLALAPCRAPAALREYDLTISPLRNEAGASPHAIAINGSIPGPVLRFRQGDTARIHVRNGMPRGEVSLHWHGILLPNVQDGVPWITTPPILPGASHTFEFPLKHAGTYWYHSHTGLQEQQGVYGAIVVEPATPQRRVDHDAVMLLSDWTAESPTEVMRTLMRGSGWYSIRKGTAQSILGAARAGASREYWQREKTRVPAMDVSDVAYDAFWINGQPRQTQPARPGDRVRLRLINGGASTYFYVESSTGPLTIVAADGMNVQPISQKRLLIGMGETYDVLLTVPGPGAWEVRATSQDGTGHASLYIGSGQIKPAADIPRVDPYRMDASLAAVLEEADAHPAQEEAARPLPPYARLRSPHPTTLPATAPRRTLELRLSGDMTRYLWTINGTTATEDSTISVKRGEILRLVLQNDSMMHHPMHLHGHFFRLLMPGGPPASYAPLKHTVDVPPMGRRTIEFYASEDKDWVFHCHLLYHMHAGMMKVISYDDQGPEHRPRLNLKEENPFYLTLDADILTNMTMGRISLMDARNDFMVMWDAGWHHPSQHMEEPRHSMTQDTHSMDHKHTKSDGLEYEIDLTWQRYLSPRRQIFAGYRLTNTDDQESSGIAGLRYLFPWMIAGTLTVETTGDFRATLQKDLQLSSRLRLTLSAEYDTAEDFSWSTSTSWALTKQAGLVLSYDSRHGPGAGLALHF